MIRFDTFNKNTSAVDKFNLDSVIVSAESFGFMIESLNQKNEPYAIIVPKSQNPINHVEIRNAFQKMQYGLYPVGAINKSNVPQRLYLLTKKPSLSLEQFKAKLTECYYNLNNFSVVFSEHKNLFKVLHNDELLEVNKTLNTDNVSKVISENVLHKRINILGIEVPLNSDFKIHYKNNGLMIFPLDESMKQSGKVWKTLLNG